MRAYFILISVVGLTACSSPEWKAEEQAERETLCRQKCARENSADITQLRACSYHCHPSTRVRDPEE